ncbi:hypothetical protein HYPSUDRAFT_576046 [Hypholoma sublateritium FD-334 SS-4]|uniref:Uncharacterized protein n=1 Tax=Hypholoma sublateritium (strain FD-334 SS-4) TaxID=945553 RepID=A0A0D2NXS7_HYPSF|nr:hypothetical protein HYPSUDRAFT_576046 [Hypholoma sublateritium FD-334 SS-4]
MPDDGWTFVSASPPTGHLSETLMPAGIGTAVTAIVAVSSLFPIPKSGNETCNIQSVPTGRRASTLRGTMSSNRSPCTSPTKAMYSSPTPTSQTPNSDTVCRTSGGLFTFTIQDRRTHLRATLSGVCSYHHSGEYAFPFRDSNNLVFSVNVWNAFAHVRPHPFGRLSRRARIRIRRRRCARLASGSLRRHRAELRCGLSTSCCRTPNFRIGLRTVIFRDIL